MTSLMDLNSFINFNGKNPKNKQYKSAVKSQGERNCKTARPKSKKIANQKHKHTVKAQTDNGNGKYKEWLGM